MNFIFKNKISFNLYKFPSYTFARFSKTPTMFDTTKSGKPNRSERGIWHRKNHSSGFKKTFSMKHNLRKFYVNVVKTKLYSDTLKKTFFLNVSTKALKTIKYYGNLFTLITGSFDKYLTLSNYKNLDSALARYLRDLIIKKQKNKYAVIPDYLPFTQKNTGKKKMARSKYYDVPSIYIPPELKRTDLSELYYDETKFKSRVEKEREEEILKRLEYENDPEERNKLKDELDEDKYKLKLQEEMVQMMPVRAKIIRDYLVKLKDKPQAKFHYLGTLEKSENYAKLIAGDKYKHFSEDYPEVQLILQQTEQERIKKSLQNKNFEEYQYEFGKTYSQQGKDYDPFAGKQGDVYNKPVEIKEISKKEKVVKEKKHHVIKRREEEKKKKVEKKKLKTLNK